AGHPEAHRTRLRVRARAERRRAAAEHLRARRELRVHLEADDCLVLAGSRALKRPPARLPRFARSHGPSSGRRVRHVVACSYACATRRIVASSNARPTRCRPIGRPVVEKPQGTETPGFPERFAGTVKMSFRYIASGSSFSPCLNATPGVVGPTITSTFSNAASKSRRIRVRTFCALP